MEPSREEFEATGRQSFSYFLSSKNNFRRPVLTHQFRVRWPWPTHSSGAGRRNGEGDRMAHAAATSSSRTSSPEHGSGVPSTAGSSPVVDVTSRWYGRSTVILSLSADPHTSPDGNGESAFDQHRVARVAMLLSPGHRFYLPLLPASSDKGGSGGGGGESSRRSCADSRGEGKPTQYWRVAYKPSRDGSARVTPPPMFTELVLGELAAVEWVMDRCQRQLKGRSRFVEHPAARRGDGSPFSPLINLGVTPSATASVVRDDDGADGEAAAAAAAAPATTGDAAGRPYWVRPSPRPSQLPVHAYLMHSVPFKVLWLGAVAERVLISLPCEERLVTLHVPQLPRGGGGGGGGSGGVPGYTGGQCEPVSLRASHAFSFPRGVVPLDVVELLHRPFVAVGTCEHGVLVCWLDVDTGAVQGIAQAVAMAGVSSAVFPVTRLAAVFPPRWASAPHLNWPARSPATPASSPALRFSASARDLASLASGALVCCSTYDMQSVVVKNVATSAATSAVCEDFSTGKQHDSLLSVSPTVDEDVGVLCVTTQGTLVRHQVFAESADQYGGRDAARCVERPRKRFRHADRVNGTGRDESGDVKDDDESVSEREEADEEPELEGGEQAGEGGRDVGLDLLRQHERIFSSLLSERVAPIVLRTSCIRRPMRLHRLNDSAPVFQLKPSKWSRLDGAMVAHFAVASTVENEVVLLDRVLTIYKPLSTFKLSSCVPTQTPDSGGREGSGEEAGARGRDAAAPERGYVEDMCAGLVFLSAGHQWLTVAAAHHTDTVSILTYAGDPAEIGMLRRSYQKS